MNINFEKISFIILFIIVFYEIIIKLKSVFELLKIIYWKAFRHSPATKIIYIPILNIWRFFILIIIVYVFVISFSILINRVTYSSSYTFLHFSTINNTSISVKRSNFTLVFFKATCHANPGTERKFAGSSSYISRHTFLKLLNTVSNNNVSFWTFKSSFGTSSNLILFVSLYFIVTFNPSFFIY